MPLAFPFVRRRVHAVLSACVACSCGGASKDGAPAPVPVAAATGLESSPPDSDAEPASGGKSKATACKSLAEPMPKLVRMHSQGSHADARVELSLDLSSGRLQGTDYRLEGDDPQALPVDQQVPPESLAAFRKLLTDTCAARRRVEVQERSAPGGSSSFELVNASGESLWVVAGASNLVVGAEVASVEREQWKALFAAWPASEGK